MKRKIIDEMFQLETYLHGPNGRMRARVQTIFKMIQHCSAQQLTYLLRTCPPHVTLHASRRLDEAIANTIHRIMDCVPLLPPHDSIAMRAVLNRFFLPVRLGGDGFINSEATREAAYAASMIYCGPMMRNAVPTLGTSDLVAPSVQALLDATGSLRAQGVQCIPTVDSTLLWTLPLQSGLQKRIHSELVAHRRTAAMASLPTGEPRNGLGVFRPLTTDESAIRRQGIINMTCRDSSQWLNANPAYLFNRMNNEAFTLAYKRRSMRRLMGSRTNCVCGAEIDLFGDHVLVCPRVTVRNQVRNTGHSDVSNDLRNIFKSRQTAGKYYVANGEPLMDRYLQRIDVAAVNPDEINRRADIALIRMGLDGPGTTLIDVTLAAHNIHQPGPDYTVGLAANNSALRKHQFYNRLYQPPGPDTQLIIFAFETSGSIHPEARTFLRDHVAAGTTHNPGLEFGNIIKTISVSLQTALAKCVLTARTRLTLDQPPTYPYVAGPLALPDPPSRLYPDHQLPRHDAVPSLSRRPLLFPLRALATAPPPPVHASPVMLSLA